MQTYSKRALVAWGAAALSALALTLSVGAAAAAEGTEFMMKGYESTVSPQVQWKDSTAIPAGAKMILLYGDPKKDGPYIFRVKFPAGYKLPAHKHPDQRIVTVLQGNYWTAVGEKFEQSKLVKFTPGSFYTTEPNAPHFAWAETEVVIQEMGTGPIDSAIDYVDATEDPRKK
ncbi:MAG: cupin domain-containing protein [Betaproteobacteria bacterium]